MSSDAIPAEDRKDETMRLAVMITAGKANSVFKEMRKSGKSVKKALKSMDDEWKGVLKAIKEDNVFRDAIAPPRSCLYCAGICGKVKERRSDPWNSEEMRFLTCGEFQNVDSFMIVAGNKYMLMRYGSEAKKSIYRPGSSPGQLAFNDKWKTYSVDSNCIVKIVKEERAEDPRMASRKEVKKTAIVITSIDKLRRCILDAMMNGYELSTASFNESYTVRGLVPEKSERYSSYMNRVHNKIRSERANSLAKVNSMTDDELKADIVRMIRSSGVSKILASMDDDVEEFISTYFPGKTLREIYKELKCK
jgi:hypothetical protein